MHRTEIRNSLSALWKATASLGENAVLLAVPSPTLLLWSRLLEVSQTDRRGCAASRKRRSRKSPHVACVARQSFQSNLSRVTRRRDDVHHFRRRETQRVTTIGQLLPGLFEQFSVHTFLVSHLIRNPPLEAIVCHLMHLKADY